MDIIPLGHASFKLKGKKAAVVCDPYNQDLLGIKFPRHTTADIVTVSHAHKDHNCAKIIEPDTDKVIVFYAPGEYEAKGVDIMGIPTFHDYKNGTERGKNTVFKIDIDEVSVVHLGDLGHKLSEQDTDALDGVDVLFVPVGGIYTLDLTDVSEVISELEPKIVIPMHYQRQEEYFKELMPLSAFLKEMGIENILPVPKLKVTQDSLPEKTQIVVLE